MKHLLFNLFTLIVLTHSVLAQNKLTESEQQQGWQLLLKGESTQGWHTYLKTSVEPAWKVDNGVLKLDPKAAGQGDLLTDKEYENFELSLEWNIAEGGNSGIIFGVHEDSAFQATYETGIEMQVLDNKNAEDNKKANHLAGSLYDMRAPAQDVAKPAGQWNLVKLRKQNGHLTFFLNNVKIVETQMGSDEWKTMIENSKFKTWKNFAAYPKGHIALQDHGFQVSFRDIKIREL